MISIRKATVEDASAIATVHVAAWKETYRGIVADEVLDNLSVQRRTEQWVNSLSDDAHAYHQAFVAEVDRQVVGFSNFGTPQIKDSDFDGELFAIYILKAAHKMGVGRMLVQAVVNGLREQGHRSMIVWVLKDNPARGFYEKLGGVYLYEKPIEIGKAMLMEAAYGWRDLSVFPAYVHAWDGLAGTGGERGGASRFCMSCVLIVVIFNLLIGGEMQERIVITGMGAVSPLGLNVKESWSNAAAGVSGVAPIKQFDPHAANLQVHIAAEVKNFQPEQFMEAREARRRDRFEQFAVAASKEAVNDSGLQVTEQNAGRIGVIISSAIGGLHSLQEATLTNYKEGPRKVSPFMIPMLMANGGAGMVAIELGMKGPCFSVSSACASGADGIGTALMMLRTGMIDAALAGASEATITSTGVAAFDRVGAMSRKNDNYSMTPQPFDKNRDGLVMGEGAAVLVLERESDAKARGANILAELAGYGATADAYHVTAPHEHGEGGAAAMRMALASAKANIDEVGYINAHGTGTSLNDQSETRAVKAAFGDLAYKVPISSTKSMTGHMMGATGALEVMFCVKAINEGILPPTIHYETPDPECDLDYIPNKAREAKITLAISNAFGFGGHNAVLAIRKYS